MVFKTLNILWSRKYTISFMMQLNIECKKCGHSLESAYEMINMPIAPLITDPPPASSTTLFGKILRKIINKWVSYLINEESVCRATPAIPVLLNIVRGLTSSSFVIW